MTMQLQFHEKNHYDEKYKMSANYGNSIMISAAMVANYILNVNYINSIFVLDSFGVFTMFITLYSPNLRESFKLIVV